MRIIRCLKIRGRKSIMACTCSVRSRCRAAVRILPHPATDNTRLGQCLAGCTSSGWATARSPPERRFRSSTAVLGEERGNLFSGICSPFRLHESGLQGPAFRRIHGIIGPTPAAAADSRAPAPSLQRRDICARFRGGGQGRAAGRNHKIHSIGLDVIGTGWSS